MSGPRIIGDGQTYMAKAFYDVRDFLAGYDVVLFAQMAKLLGETVPTGSLVYNMEPLYDGCGLVNLGYLDLLRRCRVVDYQKRNVDFLRSHGVLARYLPYGYQQKLERVQPAAEDIDVLFFGGVNDRRIAVLKELERSGLNYRIVTYGCYGLDLDMLVARAKVVLNMHYQASHPLESVRLNYCLANKKLVVSERGWDTEENAIYESGLVFAEYSDLVKTCAHYVMLETEREFVASEGQKLVRSLVTDLSILGGL